MGEPGKYDGHQAVTVLLRGLPEFEAEYSDSDGHPDADDDGQLLLHVVMGDLARFYMAHGLGDAELAARFWRTVEDLAANGNQYVAEAVHTSLVEWFAWGDDAEQGALREAESMQRPETRAMVRAYHPAW